jgi:hypothetical protein
MSFEAEPPDAPAPRGLVDWLRFGAIVAGAMAATVVAFFLGGPLDALAATWGLPHRLSLSTGLATATTLLGMACIAREWSRPARRFLSARGLPRSDR